MTEELTTAAGRYIYAIIRTPAAASAEKRPGFPWVSECIGFEGRAVYPIPGGPVAAVVSDIPNHSLRAERRNLAVHYDVLKRLMKQEAVLPMAFGIIADSSDAIRRVLRWRQSTLVDQLERVAGKAEMGLKVTWTAPNIFEYFVNTHDELRTLRDELFRDGRDPPPQEKIELGRLFQRTLNEDRAEHTRTVLSVLRPLCFEIKENKLRTEREVMNLACLVGQGSQTEFERGVFEAAKRFDDNYSFDFSGPFLPHNFVEVDLRA